MSTSYQGRAQKPTYQLDIPGGPDSEPFKELLALLHEKMVENAIASADTFVSDKKARGEDRVRESFTPLIKENSKVDEKTGKIITAYDPSIRLKVSLKKDTAESDYDNAKFWDVVVEDAEGTKVDPSKLNNKNSQIMALMDVRGAMNTKTGNSIQLIAARVRILAEGGGAEAAAGDEAWGDCDIVQAAKKRKTEGEKDESAGFGDI
jgi:hypothetical protein